MPGVAHDASQYCNTQDYQWVAISWTIPFVEKFQSGNALNALLSRYVNVRIIKWNYIAF